jgi:hypothetical protein
MHVAAKSKILNEQLAPGNADLSSFVPDELVKLGDPQTAIPRIAKDAHLIRLIERAIHQIPTSHSIYRGDARNMSDLEPNSVRLVLTSPPYWTLKEYRDSEGQLGHVQVVPTPRLANEPLPNLAYTTAAWRLSYGYSSHSENSRCILYR